MGVLASHQVGNSTGILSTIMIKIKYNFILISCLINNSSCSCSGFRNLCECLSLSVFVNIDSLSWHRGRDRGDSLPSTDLMRKKEKTVLIIYRGHFTQITSDFCPPLDRLWSWTKKGNVVCFDREMQCYVGIMKLMHKWKWFFDRSSASQNMLYIYVESQKGIYLANSWQRYIFLIYV